MTRSGILVVIVIAVTLVAVGGIAGFFLGHSGGASSGGGEGERKPLYWTDPMIPNYRSDKPGKSPMGMDLVPVYAEGESGASSSDVQISPAVVNALGVRTAEVKKGPLARRIEAVGYVAYDEDLVASINTRAEGWIEKLNVKAEGDAVRAGEPLYELFSPKLATAEQEHLTALASGMPSLIAASRERLHALGFAPQQIHDLERTRKASGRVPRYAEQNGVVTALGVREGAYVMPATQVMKIADISAVWVAVEADESDAAALQTGQSATAAFDAFPGETRQGTVDYIYPDIEAATRTAKVRIRFGNADGRLRPNMYAHVTIAGAPRSALYIPSSALIRTGRSERVAVALGGGRFDICPVVAGFETGSNVEILKGLRVGQRVVVSSQFLIDSEANLDAAALRIGGGKPDCNANAKKQMPGMKVPAPPKRGRP